MAELFRIDTEAVHLVWGRRRDARPPVRPEAPPDRPFGLVVEALHPDVTPQTMLAQTDPPYLFEQTDYTLFIRTGGDHTVAVRHRDPVVLRGLHTSDGGRVVHGLVNVGAQVGASRFVIAVDGEPQFAVQVEFVPSKLDYRDDYRALRDDVERLARGLALTHLRPTTQAGRSEAVIYPTTLDWLTLLRATLDDLERALRYVDHHPHRATAPVQTHVRADRIRRPDATVRRAVLRAGGRGPHLAVPDLVPVRAYLPADQHRYTLDTPEHRWLATCLDRIHLRLAELLDDEQHRHPGVRRRLVLREIETMQHRLADLMHLPVLTAVEGESPLQPTQRLRTAPGYREAYQACLRLQRGLFLDGDPLRLALKDLHLLYEYWCTLTLVRLLATRTGDATPLRDLVAVEQRGLALRLRRGRRQRIRFATDEQLITVTYNPHFGGRDVLVPQQPDLLLSIQSAEGDAAHYILDAKYRLDASPRYRKRYDVPGPPPDALNTLHRYRDAIRIRGRQAAQAVVLYPWRDADDQYPQSRHHRVLDQRGVGAIPLLPGATKYLHDWLEGIIRGTAGG